MSEHQQSSESGGYGGPIRDMGRFIEYVHGEMQETMPKVKKMLERVETASDKIDAGKCFCLHLPFGIKIKLRGEFVDP